MHLVFIRNNFRRRLVIPRVPIIILFFYRYIVTPRIGKGLLYRALLCKKKNICSGIKTNTYLLFILKNGCSMDYYTTSTEHSESVISVIICTLNRKVRLHYCAISTYQFYTVYGILLYVIIWVFRCFFVL